MRPKTPPPPPCRSTSLPPSPANAPSSRVCAEPVEEESPTAAPGPNPVPSPGPTLTQLEDCFSEQVWHGRLGASITLVSTHEAVACLTARLLNFHSQILKYCTKYR